MDSSNFRFFFSIIERKLNLFFFPLHFLSPQLSIKEIMNKLVSTFIDFILFFFLLFFFYNAVVWGGRGCFTINLYITVLSLLHLFVSY